MKNNRPRTHAKTNGKNESTTPNLYKLWNKPFKSETRNRQFYRVLSHALRNPLNGALGFADLIAKSPNAPETIPHVRQGLRQLSHTLDGLLDLAAFDMGLIKPHWISVDAVQFWKNTLTEWDPWLMEKSILAQVEFPSSPLWIRTDLDWLKSLAQEIFSNALQEAPPRSTLGLRIKATKGRVSTELFHKGRRIIPRSILKQGIPFQNNRTENHNGLGLALASRIALFLGATLKVHAEKPEQVVTQLTLPWRKKK